MNFTEAMKAVLDGSIPSAEALHKDKKYVMKVTDSIFNSRLIIVDVNSRASKEVPISSFLSGLHWEPPSRFCINFYHALIYAHSENNLFSVRHPDIRRRRAIPDPTKSTAIGATESTPYLSLDELLVALGCHYCSDTLADIIKRGIWTVIINDPLPEEAPHDTY